jgi:ADP-dependent phosphofructokinase/glucokinase
MNWPDAYAEVAERVARDAPDARPIFTGTSACVDAVFRMGTDRLEKLAKAKSAGLINRVLDRISRGRGGELLTRWPSGPAWIMELLGEPDRYQVGGTGPQASWALAAVGAPSVLALADRSAEQLAVIETRAGLCEFGAVVPASAITASGEPSKHPHCVLEFTAGTACQELTITRSSRIILRFGDEPVERDDEYLAVTAKLAPDAGAGLVSGLNGPEDQAHEARWLHGLVEQWSRAGLKVIHHELAEFPSVSRLRAAGGLKPVTSVGLSLSELFMLSGADTDPAGRARDLAEQAGAERVVVHADDWALAVHRGSSDARQTLLTGNALAAARARAGQPTAALTPPSDATYTDDRPRDGALGDGWYADCVPAPHLRKPASTVGLGDTFVAGILLADSLPTP